MRRFSLIITAPTGSRIVRLLPEGEVTLGRNPICDIVLSEEQISRQHAKIIVRDGGVSLEDLGSNNGTFVNGERLSRPQTVTGGDTITIGSFKLAVSEGEATDGKRAAPPNRTPPPPIARSTRPPNTGGTSSGANPSVPAVLAALASMSAPSPSGNQLPVSAPLSTGPVTTPLGPPSIDSVDVDSGEDINPWSADGIPDDEDQAPVTRDDEDLGPPFEEEDQTVRLRASQLLSDPGVRRLEQLEVLEVGAKRAAPSAQQRAAEDIRRTEALARTIDAYARRPENGPKELIAALVAILGADTAVLLAGEGGAEEMQPRAIHHREPLDDGEVPISRAVLKEAVEQRAPVVTADIRGDDRFDVGASLFLYNVAAVMAVPLLSRDRVLGALYVNRWRSGSFDPQDVAFAGALANLAAMAMAAPAGAEAPRAPALARQLGEKAARAASLDDLAPFRTEDATALVTSLAELEPFLARLGPQRSGEILTVWREHLSRAIFEAGGVLLGMDGLTARALFRHQPGAADPTGAARAALQCRRSFAEWMTERMPRIRVRPRFGLHSGRCMLGAWGPREAPELVAVGEALEGAQHLEQAAAPGELIASPSTAALLTGQFELGPIDPARLAGAPEELSRSMAVFSAATR